MICRSENKYEVGKIVTPKLLTDTLGNRVESQPVYIIREASLEEYEAQSELHKNLRGRYEAFYYEVSVD